MTNITELAQSLKAAAEKATPGPWVVVDHFWIAPESEAFSGEFVECHNGPDAQYLKLLSPENVRALVEALEKAQQRISELESPTFTFEVTAEPFTCPRCGTTTTHPEGWHYCHKREAE